MQPATLLARERGADDEVGDRGEVAQFDQVGVDFVVSVVVVDLAGKVRTLAVACDVSTAAGTETSAAAHSSAVGRPVFVNNDSGTSSLPMS